MAGNIGTSAEEFQPALFDTKIGAVKRQRFAYFLAQGETSAKAYVLAGYAGDPKGSEPSRLACMPEVVRMFNRALQSRNASQRITKEWLDEAQLKMAGVDARGRLHYAYQLIDPKTNTPKRLADCPRPLRRLVKGIKYTKRTTLTKAGDMLTEELTEFQLHDQYAILRDLKSPLEKLAFLVAQQEALRGATQTAEEAAQRIRDAMLAMAVADGVPLDADYHAPLATEQRVQ